MVLYCIDKNISIDELSIEELKELSPVFEQDVYEAVSIKTCVEKRLTKGAPGPQQMKEVLKLYKAYLDDVK